MRSIVRDVVGMAGVAMVVLGAGMIYRPAGYIAGGITLVVFALFGFAPEKKAGD